MNDEDSIGVSARALVSELIVAGKRVTTAESCTGGWIATSITDIPGSSACFGYGMVSYSNEAKQSLLGVKPRSLAMHGAVSEEVVTEMATGALRVSTADFAVAVSGIAGPDGGSADKPVGTVWFAWATRQGSGGVTTKRRQFEGDRQSVRAQTVVVALEGLRARLRTDG